MRIVYGCKILSSFVFAMIITLFQSGCQSGISKLVQFSSTVPTVTEFKIPDDSKVLFFPPELSKIENFRGVLKEFNKPDYYFNALHGDGISLEQRENFLSQPFQNWFPNLDINDFFIKHGFQIYTSETAIPLKAKVTLLSTTVDRRNPFLINSEYTWRLRLFFENSNQEEQFLDEKDFKISSRTVFNPENENSMPPARFSGKFFKVKFDYNIHSRDSGYNTQGQDTYNKILKHSILHSSLDILNKNTEKISEYAKQRRKIINASKIDRHWAIVIGVAKYQYNSGGLNNLTYADNDAYAMMKVFLNKLNWPRSRVKLLVNENATKSHIMRQITNVVSKMGENDMLTIYWSGHGFVNSSETYFACYDTQVENISTAISMNTLRNMLESKKVKNLFFIADTCHAGALATGTRGLNVSSISKSITPVGRTMQNQGWIFMLAAESDRQAVEDRQWGHGAFTYFILKGLNGAADGYEGSGNVDNIITPAELRAYLRHMVPFETQKILGTAVHPLIHTNSANTKIWDVNIYEEE